MLDPSGQLLLRTFQLFLQQRVLSAYFDIPLVEIQLLMLVLMMRVGVVVVFEGDPLLA